MVCSELETGSGELDEIVALSRARVVIIFTPSEAFLFTNRMTSEGSIPCREEKRRRGGGGGGERTI